MTTWVAPTVSGGQPFPGLRPFGFNDHKFFFGRSEQIYALYRLVDHSRFVAVVGSSGSGKSSLVRAGLLPLLEEESQDPGGRTWRWRIMRPGDAPLARLRDVLAELSEADDPAVSSARRARIEFYLKQSSFGIIDVLSETESLADKAFLLVVDQFEELFRYAEPPGAGNRDPHREARSRDEAAHFVQLLLEASRSPARNVVVMLTMRSDFIGDCARFHGLPEAVSAVQFLVPSLSRDQLEEVIRAPIARAGATIDPVLVEIILNESSDELDQLPVLQHCLLRLWEQAGWTSKTADEVGVGREDGLTAEKAGRYLDIGHYEAIGRLADALSRHAEEIYKRLQGQTLAVEQVFRSLAEIDREGRAIRRAIRFDRLHDETCDPEDKRITEGDLHRVLDEFRADECSFLLPLRSEVGTLESDTRIDVGHEALLRRWERVCGRRDSVNQESVLQGATKTSPPSHRSAPRWSGPPGWRQFRFFGRRLNERDRDQTKASTDPTPEGWLRAEQHDGLRYRALLTMIERDDRAIIPLDQVNEWRLWWEERPRTEGWAERYGGDFGRIKQLLEDSRRVLKERTLLIWTAAVAGTLLLIAVGWLVYQYHIEGQKMAAAHRKMVEQAATAEHNFGVTIVSSNQLLHQLIDSVNRGSVTVEGGRELLNKTAQIVNGMRAQLGDHQQSTETAKLDVAFRLIKSDLEQSLGETSNAFESAQEAKDIAEIRSGSEPGNAEWRHLLYESVFRLAEAEIALKQDKTTLAKVLAEFTLAQRIAEQLALASPQDGERQLDLALVHSRIGDVHEVGNNIPAALAEDQLAAAITGQLVDRNAANAEWRRELASAQYRVGRSLAALNRTDEAMAQFRLSLANRERLMTNDRDNDIYPSNAAASHSEIARLLDRTGDLEGTDREFRAAIEILERLTRKDPQNAISQSYLAPEYARYAAFLEKQGKEQDALDYFGKSLSIRQDLASRDPKNIAKQRPLATVATQVADRLMTRNLFDKALAHYRIALAARTRLVADNPDSFDRQHNLSETHAKIGDVLMAKGDSSAASTEYQAVLDIARQVAGKESGNAARQTEVASASIKLGEAFEASARTQDAVAHYREASNILEGVAAKDPQNTVWQGLRKRASDALARLAASR
jgi:tetratricopeptide (TPR) repeat protein